MVSFFLPATKVKAKGTTMATTMQSANAIQHSNLMDRIPGRPPTPMDSAWTPRPVQSMAAHAEPIMPQTSGKRYLRLTPKSAGSVTPR